MANPYDFTSGYLGASQLREQRAQAIETAAYRDKALLESKADRESKERITGPYYEAAAIHARAQGRGLDATTDAALYGLGRKKYIDRLFVDPQMKKLSKSMGIQVDDNPLDFPSIGGGYTLGIKPDYSLTKPLPGAVPVDAPQLADGTVGGISMDMPQQTNQVIGRGISDQLPPQTVIAQDETTVDAPPQNAPPVMKSGLEVLGDRNPKQADAVARNVYGMTDNEFRKLSGVLALADFGSGKMTSTDLTIHVRSLDKMQKEGVLSAANEVLAGNEKKAIQIYHQNGEDTDSVVSMKKTMISNPIASVFNDKKGKGTKDTYEGVIVTMKDGSTLTLDPRRLATDIIGVAKSMEYDAKVQGDLRQQESSKYSADATNAATAEYRKGREATKEQELDRQYMILNKNSYDAEIERQVKINLDLKGINAKTNPAEHRAEYAEISRSLGAAHDLANFNITALGNRKATFGATMAAIKNPQPVLDSSGKPITKDANGQLFALMASGVYLPVGPPPSGAPAQTGAPAPVSAPPQTDTRQQAIPSQAQPGQAAPVRRVGRSWILDVPSEIRDSSVPYYRTIKNPAADLSGRTFYSKEQAEAAYWEAVR
jgi:hypothetical protein